jgi:hypothetical protein
VWVAKDERGKLAFSSLLHGRATPLRNLDMDRFVSDIQDGVLVRAHHLPTHELLDGWYLEPEAAKPSIASVTEFTRSDGNVFYQAQTSRLNALKNGAAEELTATRAFKSKDAALKWMGQMAPFAGEDTRCTDPETPPLTDWDDMLALRVQEAEARERAHQEAIANEERMRKEAASRRLRERLEALTSEPIEKLSTDEFAELRRLKRQLRGAA